MLQPLRKGAKAKSTDLSVHPRPSHRHTQSLIQSGINCGPAHTPPRGQDSLFTKKNYLRVWVVTLLYFVHNIQLYVMGTPAKEDILLLFEAIITSAG